MKKVWIAGIAVAVILLGGGIMWWQRAKSAHIVTPEADNPVAAPTPEEFLTWEDQSGFSFRYPKSITIDKHAEDEVNYAHIELTDKNNPGTIIIWAKDTSADDAAA